MFAEEIAPPVDSHTSKYFLPTNMLANSIFNNESDAATSSIPSAAVVPRASSAMDGPPDSLEEYFQLDAEYFQLSKYDC